MNPIADNANATAWEGPGDRARQVMRDYLDILRGYMAVRDTEEDPAHVQHTRSRPLEAANLPANMRQLLEKYKHEHPGAILQPVGYLAMGETGAAPNTCGFTSLPREEDLVILALTETVATAGGVEARSQVLLLQRGKEA